MYFPMLFQVEECEEIELIIESEDEDIAEGIEEDERSSTPTPIQDFGANTVYTDSCKLFDPSLARYRSSPSAARFTRRFALWEACGVMLAKNVCRNVLGLLL